MSIDFGMPTLIENAALQQNIDLCAALGLRFIELNMNFPEYQVDRLGDWEAFIRPAERAGIYYTIHLDETLNVADFNPLVRQAYLETVKRTVDAARRFLPLAARYGGDAKKPVTVNMHMCHGIYITLPDRKVQLYDRDFAVYYDYFRFFRDQAEKWIGTDPIRISIENTDGFRSYEQRVIDMLLESPVFCLTWDIGHSRATGEKDMEYILSRSRRLCHMHIHDGTEVPAKNHLALGTGQIDLAERLRTAKECQTRCVLETKTVAALKQSVLWLQQNGEL